MPPPRTTRGPWQVPHQFPQLERWAGPKHSDPALPRPLCTSLHQVARTRAGGPRTWMDGGEGGREPRQVGADPGDGVLSLTAWRQQRSPGAWH